MPVISSLRDRVLGSAAMRSAAAGAAGSWIRRRRPTLVTRVAPEDRMFHGLAALNYFSVGADALSLVRQSLMLAGTGVPQRILDLPCGYGRVLRWLRAEWPAATVTACDLDAAAVRWSAAAFRAEGLLSRPSVEEVDLGRGYDLVWVGSLFTHFDRDRWRPTLAHLAAALRVGGVLVFTTHGQEHVHRMVGLPPGAGDGTGPQLVAGWEDGGFGYADYPGTSGYGVSVSRPEWVRAQVAEVPGLDPLAEWIAGWNHHQDVFAYRRVEG